jgi:uncharacterized ion transporter superfamily protein YfcC
MPPTMYIWLLLLETSVLYLFLYISKLLSYNRVTRSRAFMTYHQVYKKSSTMGATCGAGITYSSGAPEFTPYISGVRIARSLVLCIWLLLLETSVLYLFLYISKLLSYNRITRSRKSNKNRQPNDKKKNRQMNTILQHKTGA